MEIKNSTREDIDEIFNLYKSASTYQKEKKKVIVWPNFERGLVENEIAENRQWKILIDNNIACVWAITFEDEDIWEERNKDSAIYIHRIATNPEYRGNNFVGKIVEWAKNYAISLHKDFVRLDTVGYNPGLIKHYTNAGFKNLGMFKLKNTEALPEHYHKDATCLFEIELKKFTEKI